MPTPFPKGHKFAKGGKRDGAGRPRDVVVREIKKLAQAYDVEALERLAYWMRSDNARASVSACTALLDRAHGKPDQAIGVDPENNKIIVEFKQ